MHQNIFSQDWGNKLVKTSDEFVIGYKLPVTVVLVDRMLVTVRNLPVIEFLRVKCPELFGIPLNQFWNLDSLESCKMTPISSSSSSLRPKDSLIFSQRSSSEELESELISGSFFMPKTCPEELKILPCLPWRGSVNFSFVKIWPPFLFVNNFLVSSYFQSWARKY